MKKKAKQAAWKQDGGTYGLSSGYGFWSCYIDGVPVRFYKTIGGASTKAQREKLVREYYDVDEIIHIDRGQLLAEIETGGQGNV